MRYLLDTCTFLWLAQNPGKLSAKTVAVLNEPHSELFVSHVSIWEVTLKHASGKLPLPEDPRIWIPRKLFRHSLRSFPLTHDAIFCSGELPKTHMDPFDRLLAAQALEAQMTLLSPDTPISTLGVARVW